MAAQARRKRVTELGELQLEVLDRLSKLGQGTVYDVLGEFRKRERPRYTTVLTVLRSLESRGLVRHSERDRAYVFEPTPAGASVKRKLLQDLLTRVFDDSPRELMAALVEVDGVTPEVLEDLKELIAAKEADDGR